jgi:DNA-directed RNA polymerase subunit alpha
MTLSPQQMVFIAKNWRDLIRPRDLVIVDRGDHHVFASDRDGEVAVRLDARGERIVTAADIALADGIACATPGHRLCTLAGDQRLAIELVIGVGRGYAPAQRHAAAHPGMLALDALFAPVRRVDFTVTQARVGHHTDYDGLLLDVWTNGALDPVAAVARSAQILRDHLGAFLNFEEVPEPAAVPRDERDERRSENLWRSVDEIELSMRATNCLRNLNIRYIGELVTKTESELLKSRGFGRKSLHEIAAVLAEMELQLGMKIDGWSSAKPAPPG